MRPIQREWNHFARHEVPRPFRKAGFGPVAGGRWSIRKYEGRPERPWRAWCSGKARRYSTSFATAEEAILYAHAIAKAFYDRDPWRAEQIRRDVRAKRFEEEAA